MMAAEAPQPKFRLKKRAIARQQRQSGVDFMFENPADGRFKDLECVKGLLVEFPDQVFKRVTSYCQYGFAYQKRTLFIGTLPTFVPAAPCPESACQWLRKGASHPGQVVGTPQAEKNSIPPLLVDLIVDSWMKFRVAKTYLLVDVFSGWGSIEQRVCEQQLKGRWMNVRVFSNDIVHRAHTDCNLDMQKWTPSQLLVFSMLRFWASDIEEASKHPKGVAGWLVDSGTTILFHTSTPCETYSVNGLCVHRVKGSAQPKSEAAVRADALNTKLVSNFKFLCLSPSPLLPFLAT